MFHVPPELRADAKTPENPPLVQEVLPPITVENKPKEMESIRDEKGRIKPGHTLPGNGRPKKSEAERKYGPRARELMNQYTIAEMKELISSAKAEKMHPWDAIIIRNIVAAYVKGGDERTKLVEHVDGRPKIQKEEGDTGTNIYNQTIIQNLYE